MRKSLRIALYVLSALAILLAGFLAGTWWCREHRALFAQPQEFCSLPASPVGGVNCCCCSCQCGTCATLTQPVSPKKATRPALRGTHKSQKKPPAPLPPRPHEEAVVHEAPKPPSTCYEFSFDAPVGGSVRWGVGSTDGAFSPSECNAQRQGDGSWESWGGDCDPCAPPMLYIQGVLGTTAQVPQKYLYKVSATHQTLRFSEEVLKRVVYVCLETKEGIRSCGVYQRPQDWQGRHDVQVPGDLWDWRNCPS